MASVNSFMFNNLGRLGNDKSDESQRSIQNTKSANHMLSDYFSDNLSSNHVNFATKQPLMNFNANAHGNGLSGNVIDVNSLLTVKSLEERSHERLQLHERSFLTVPYMGRGSCDPALESKILKGEDVFEKRSEAKLSLTEKTFDDVRLYPLDKEMKERCEKSKYGVQEAALTGWVRGGANTREMENDPRMK
mgnify:FL=1|jgi:hypothetical protein